MSNQARYRLDWESVYICGWICGFVFTRFFGWCACRCLKKLFGWYLPPRIFSAFSILWPSLHRWMHIPRPVRADSAKIAPMRNMRWSTTISLLTRWLLGVAWFRRRDKLATSLEDASIGIVCMGAIYLYMYWLVSIKSMMGCDRWRLYHEFMNWTSDFRVSRIAFLAILDAVTSFRYR